MSSSQDLWVFRSHNPEAKAQRSYAHAALNDKTDREYARNSFGPLPQGYCERKIHNSCY